MPTAAPSETLCAASASSATESSQKEPSTWASPKSVVRISVSRSELRLAERSK
jgi:hypothetical protein